MMPFRTMMEERTPRARMRCKGGNNCSLSRLLVGLALVASITLVAVTFDAAKAEALLVWVQDNKQQGSILFLLGYMAGVVLMLPAMVMAMASGAIFGMVFGSILAWLGSCLGQLIAFTVGRYLLRDIVLDYLSRQFPKWTLIDRAMSTEGWKLVMLLRLSPIAPWNVLNYGLSVTSVPLIPYTLASSVAVLPYLLLFVYFGSLARNLADIFTGNAGLDTNTTIIMGVITAVVMVAIVWYTTHFSRKAISQALLSHSDELPIEITNDADVVSLLGGEQPHGAASIELSDTIGAGMTLANNNTGGSSGGNEITANNNSSSNGDIHSPNSQDHHQQQQHYSTSSPRGRLGGGGAAGSGGSGKEEAQQLLPRQLQRVLTGDSGDGMHNRPRSGHTTPRDRSPFGFR